MATLAFNEVDGVGHTVDEPLFFHHLGDGGVFTLTVRETGVGETKDTHRVVVGLVSHSEFSILHRETVTTKSDCVMDELAKGAGVIGVLDQKIVVGGLKRGGLQLIKSAEHTTG